MDAKDHAGAIARLSDAIDSAKVIIIGGGSGLSTSAGFEYAGERFERLFGDFIEKYGFTDMYSASFHTFDSPEEQWAFWSRYIWHNRYEPAPKDTYGKLLRLVDGKDYFVITTNVDHQFQLAGFDERRLFCTQGDYGLWQCSLPCHNRTYDNHDIVKEMVERQSDMRIPSELVPVCPKCGAPMAMNLRSDDTFVEDESWHAAASHYSEFIATHSKRRILYLELGVGFNTPSIIKYPFWRSTLKNPMATYACVNNGDSLVHPDLVDRGIIVSADIDRVLEDLLA